MNRWKVVGSLSWIVVTAILIPACGGVLAGGKKAPPPQDPTLTLTITTPAGAQSGEVTINYNLIQPQSITSNITVAFSTNGGATFAPATAGSGGEGTTGISSSLTPGTPHTFVWNSLADLGAVNNTTVQIQITPNDGLTGTAVATTNFTVNNLGATAPSVTITTPAAPQSGLVTLSYMLIDAQSAPCSITVKFSANGGATFAAATPGPGGDGSTGLASSPSPGTAHTFVWNSVADLGAVNNTTVQIQIMPNSGIAGAAVATANFTVNDVADTSGTSIGGGFPVIQPAGSVAVEAATDGTNLYIFGSQVVAAGDTEWRIEKRLCSTGALVAGFGTGGVVNSNPGPGDDSGSMHILIDSTSMYLLSARETASGAKIYNYYMEKRTLATGALVPAFNTTGTLMGTNLGTGGPAGFTMDSTAIYVAMGANLTNIPTGVGQVEKLDKTTGAYITGFGALGVVSENPTPNWNLFTEVTTDGTNLYLVGGQGGTLGDQNFSLWIEKRLCADGSLVAAFGTGGEVVEAPPVASSGGGLSIAQDGTSLYILNIQRPNAGAIVTFKLEKRSMTDGSLTTSATSAAPGIHLGAGTAESVPQLMAFSGSSIYLIAEAGVAAGDDQWWIEKRKTADLSLDATFGTAGVLTINPTPSIEGPMTGVVGGGILYVIGDQNNAGAGEWRIEAMWK
jgi:hypothetical protein